MTIRLPEELHKAIEQLAERDVRPLNDEVVWLLQRAIRIEQQVDGIRFIGIDPGSSEGQRILNNEKGPPEGGPTEDDLP